MTKICYLILVHHKMSQVSRLIRRLSGSSSAFVVHVDSKVDDITFRNLKNDTRCASPIFFAKRERARWGSFNLVKAIFNCIQSAILNCDTFDRCILLSGQDYPIKSKKVILDFFARNPTHEYIEAFPKDASDKTVSGWSPFYRFRRYHFWHNDRKHTVPFLTKPLPDFALYHGSTWWSLSRDATHYLNDAFVKDRRFRAAFRSGFLVEEACIQTMMMNSTFSHRVVGRDTTFAEWTPTSGPHPKVLLSTDFDKLVASDKLFARKFDTDVDSEILDLLDAVYDA